MGQILCLCYLGPCIYLGPSLQQQSHHVAVPAFGCYVQRCDVVLWRNRSISSSFSHRVKGKETKHPICCQLIHTKKWHGSQNGLKLHNFLLNFSEDEAAEHISVSLWQCRRKFDKYPPLVQNNCSRSFSCTVFWFSWFLCSPFLKEANAHLLIIMVITSVWLLQNVPCQYTMSPKNI